MRKAVQPAVSVVCKPGRVTQEDLADILGVSRVNLARNLAALRAEGLICTHRRCIEVLDAKALARHCSLETLQPLAE